MKNLESNFRKYQQSLMLTNPIGENFIYIDARVEKDVSFM